MAVEPLTLYKLMILYMLNKVSFPLTNTQMSGFFLDKGYTTYFVFQNAITDLLDEELVSGETVRNTSYYTITPSGVEAISFFTNKIPFSIIADIDIFLYENKYELRNEVGTMADYYKSTTKDYIVHCQIKEGESNLIELNLSVPSEEEAEIMCNNWRDASQEIYANIVKKLMSEK